jgi:hypothetical protein
LNNGNYGTIETVESGSTAIGQVITVGSIAYNFVSAFTSSATTTSPQVYESCSGCHNQTAQNLEAAILASTSTCNFTLSGYCFAPVALTWTYQEAGNGQTTAPEPTGASGMTIDNSGSATGEANIYFGTLSGTGTTNSGIKLSQAGLQ